jgi:hypothetical protein
MTPTPQFRAIACPHPPLMGQCRSPAAPLLPTEPSPNPCRVEHTYRTPSLLYSPSRPPLKGATRHHRRPISLAPFPLARALPYRRRPTPTERTTPSCSSFRLSSSLTSACSSGAVGPVGALHHQSLERAALRRPSPPHRRLATSVRPRLSLLAQHDTLAPLHLSSHTTPPLVGRAIDCGRAAATNDPGVVTAQSAHQARHVELGRLG